MNPLRFIARAALAGIFISGGLHALRDPKPLATISKDTIETLGKTASVATGVDAFAEVEPSVVVRVNGAAQLAGGIGLLPGLFRRPAAFGLILSLIPTTLAGHPFWKMRGADRAAQQVQFTKNLGIMGGLMMVLLEPRRTSWIALGKGTTEPTSTTTATRWTPICQR